MSKKKTIPDGITFYRSGKQFRWRIMLKGRKIAASTEAYHNLNDAVRNLWSISQAISYLSTKSAVLEFKKDKK